MKSHLIILGVVFCSVASARIITLTTGGPGTDATIAIRTNETFSIISGLGAVPVIINKGGRVFSYEARSFVDNSRVVMSGPADIRLFGSAADRAFITLEVLPDSFPPDKTLVLPQGTKANIVMESSTNLVDWVAISPGAFTNNPVNLFIRLRADSLP